MNDPISGGNIDQFIVWLDQMYKHGDQLSGVNTGDLQALSQLAKTIKEGAEKIIKLEKEIHDKDELLLTQVAEMKALKAQITAHAMRLVGRDKL